MDVVGTLNRGSDGRSAFPTKILVLAADETRTGGTYTLIQDANGDWSIPVTAGKTYHIKMLGLWQTTSTTAGPTWKIVYGGGAAGTLVGVLIADSSTTGNLDQVVLTGNGSVAGYSGAAVTNTSTLVSMEMVFKCTTGGTVSIHMAANVSTSGTAKTMAGSALMWTEL